MKHANHNIAYEEILAAYRDGDEARHADDFSEALEALENDRELEQWFAEDQAFDTAFRSAISTFEVPEQKPVQREVTTITRIPFLKYAAAALVIFSLSLFGLYRFDYTQQAKAETRVNELRESMASFATSTFELDLMGDDLAQLRKLTVSNGGILGEAMDTVFADGRPMGCKVIDWNGVTVSLYCFGNEKGQVVHCFVVPLNELNGPRAAQYLKSVVVHSELKTGGFIVGNAAYLLVAGMPGDDIESVLFHAQERFAFRISTGFFAANQLAFLSVSGPRKTPALEY